MLKRPFMLPLLLIVGGLIILSGVVTLWVVASPSPTPLSMHTPTLAGELVSRSQGPYPEILRVTLSAAKQAYDSGSAVFVDARGEAFFAQSHIPGSLSASAQDFDLRLEKLDRETWIIPFCS